MNGGAVERRLPVVDAQEARTLGKGGITEARDLVECLAARKASVLVAVGDDVLCNRGIDARNAVQQGGGCRVEIDADMVYGVLDRCVECLPELLLADIVLILTDADCLRVDLHEFGERVLHAPCDGDGAANCDIVVGQLVLREL